MSQTTALKAGMASIGFVIGGLVGVSASPVVGIAIPLLFSLVTAAGAAWTTRNQEDKQLKLLGIQMLAFGLAFVPGLWLGVAAKIHVTKFWFAGSGEPAYTTMSFDDPRQIATAMALDNAMKESNLSHDDRVAVFEQLETAKADRRDRVKMAEEVLVRHAAVVSGSDTAAIASLAHQLATLMGPPSRTSTLASELSVSTGRMSPTVADSAIRAFRDAALSLVESRRLSPYDLALLEAVAALQYPLSRRPFVPAAVAEAAEASPEIF